MYSVYILDPGWYRYDHGGCRKTCTSIDINPYGIRMVLPYNKL